MTNPLDCSSAHRPTAEELGRLETRIRCHLSGQIHHVRLVAGDDGIILRGRVPTYYAKQLAQHMVMQATTLPIVANEIEVS